MTCFQKCIVITWQFFKSTIVDDLVVGVDYNVHGRRTICDSMAHFRSIYAFPSVILSIVNNRALDLLFLKRVTAGRQKIDTSETG